MRRFKIVSPEKQIKIEGEEHNHIAQVLRLKINDRVICFCEDDFDYIYEVVDIQKKYTSLELIEKKQNNCNPKTNIVVFQGLPKGDKLELIIQKLNELGISEIIPFESDFTIAKFNSSKIDRLNKIAYESSKQCGRSKSLIVRDCISFKQMLKEIEKFDTVLFAYENERTIHINNVELYGNIAIIVGSEGGFSLKEVEEILKTKAKVVGLGNRILRCETASIAMSSYISFKLGV